MSVTKRMMGLLGEESVEKAQATALKQVAEESATAVIEDPIGPAGDLATKAAQVLVVGLQADLPDEPDAAIDILMDLFKQLRSNKKVVLQKAMRRMRSSSRAMSLLRQTKKEIS